MGSGVLVGSISITDPDVASMNKNVLTLEGANAANFELRNGTELYYTGASPDFETKTSYALTLKSTDGALVYTQAVTVSVTDVNDNAPGFSIGATGSVAQNPHISPPHTPHTDQHAAGPRATQAGA